MATAQHSVEQKNLVQARSDWSSGSAYSMRWVDYLPTNNCSSFAAGILDSGKGSQPAEVDRP